MKSLFVVIGIVLALWRGAAGQWSKYAVDELEASQDDFLEDPMLSVPRGLDLQDGSTDSVAGADAAAGVDYSISANTDYTLATDAGKTDNSTQTAQTIQLSTNSQLEHANNYMKISVDLKNFEAAYTACLDNLSIHDYSEENIEGCVGENFTFILNDIDFERRKILSRAEAAVRDKMITLCYQPAGADLVISNACDLLERDVIDMLWEELNFQVVVDYHRSKYLFGQARMPEAIFTGVNNSLKDTYDALDEIMTELYAHKEVTVQNLKTHIAERRQEVNDQLVAAGELPLASHQVVTIYRDRDSQYSPNYPDPNQVFAGDADYEIERKLKPKTDEKVAEKDEKAEKSGEKSANFGAAKGENRIKMTKSQLDEQKKAKNDDEKGPFFKQYRSHTEKIEAFPTFGGGEGASLLKMRPSTRKAAAKAAYFRPDY